MKKIAALIASAVLLVLIVVGLFVFKTPVGQFDFDDLPDKLELSINSRYYLKVKRTYNSGGKTVTENINKKCRFVSNDDSVVEMSNDGHIICKKIGAASVSVSCGGTTKTVNININKKKSNYIAHRGAMDFAPEDTLSSLSKAVELGYRQMECDIRIGGDGNLFVFHDRRLGKMCGVDADFSVVTLQNRVKFPIISGSNVNKVPTQYIPTLEEALDVIQNSESVDRIYLHIKQRFPERQVNMLAKAVYDRGLTDRVMLITVDRDTLRAFPKELPKGLLSGNISGTDNLCALIDDIKKEDIGINAVFYQYNSEFLPPDEFVLYAHTNGIRIVCYSIDNLSQIEELKCKGVNEIVCNRLLFLLDKKLINCSLSVKNPDGAESVGGKYKVVDEKGKEVEVFDKTASPYELNGKLSPGATYNLIRMDGDGNIGQKEKFFTIQNTDEVQTFEFINDYPDKTQPTTATQPATSTQPSTQAATKATENALRQLRLSDITCRAGKTIELVKADKSGKKLTYKSSDRRIARIKNGRLITLRKGTAVVRVTNGKDKASFKVKVTNSPRLSKKTITVKKGKTKTVTIIRKAKGVDNKYINTKKAKAVSKKSAVKVKIRGIKRGTSTLKIIVNGKRLKLKVKVD